MRYINQRVDGIASHRCSLTYPVVLNLNTEVAVDHVDFLQKEAAILHIVVISERVKEARDQIDSLTQLSLSLFLFLIFLLLGERSLHLLLGVHLRRCGHYWSVTILLLFSFLTLLFGLGQEDST